MILVQEFHSLSQSHNHIHFYDSLFLDLSKSILPEHDELIFQYYIWQPQSGISWHTDEVSDRLFGATLYLNEEWHPDFGGWFIWKENNTYHTILPKKKFLIINNNYQHHCVTPVSTGFRCTIQIWGKKNPAKI